MTAPDTTAVVLAALTPPAPTWSGMTADDLSFRFKYAIEHDLTGWCKAILTDLVAAAAEMRGAQSECADLADQREAVALELADHRADDLAAKLARYLAVRQHTLSTAGLPPREQLIGEARYVEGEAVELKAAVEALLYGTLQPAHELLAHVRHEIADVVLATTCLAGFLDVTVEACIAEKTELDRGRG